MQQFLTCTYDRAEIQTAQQDLGRALSSGKQVFAEWEMNWERNWME